ncbi:unnamed protein product, partial [Prorocentrum cordatum]
MAAVAEPSLFRARPLEPPDSVEEAGKAHFQELRRRVFDRLRIDPAGPDPNALHGHALAQLHWLAASGPEAQKSVCLGLTYALLAEDWDRALGPGYWDYLGLLRATDDHCVLIRTLLAVARRALQLRAACWERLLALLGDIAEARWPDAELVLLALQREVRPGDGRAGAARALSDLLRLTASHVDWVAASDVAARRSAVWALRWAGALQEAGSGCGGPAEACGQALELFAGLWAKASEPVLRGGPALLWSLLPHIPTAGGAPAEAWRRAVGRCRGAPGPGEEAPWRECLDHLLPSDEREQLDFLLRAEPRHSEASWPAGHPGVRRTSRRTAALPEATTRGRRTSSPCGAPRPSSRIDPRGACQGPEAGQGRPSRSAPRRPGPRCLEWPAGRGPSAASAGSWAGTWAVTPAGRTTTWARWRCGRCWRRGRWASRGQTCGRVSGRCLPGCPPRGPPAACLEDFDTSPSRSPSGSPLKATSPPSFLRPL